MHEKNKKYILVIGGAGYIGSHMVNHLQENNYHPVVLDNLSTGHADSILNAPIYRANLGDSKALDSIFSTYPISAVMHFASYIEVNESVLNPAKYYENNVIEVFTLLDRMRHWNISHLIFSSTAAVYGTPLHIPITEDHPKNPINPYGNTKHIVEKVLQDYSAAYELKYVILRYFNAAGRKTLPHLREQHEPETHLIPLVLEAAAGKRSHITVYGTDYDTPDGTCIRDYIHVLDLCNAHLLALEKLMRDEKSDCFNLGSGRGFSVRQIIETANKITRREINVIESGKRRGDPAILIADITKATTLLGWNPIHSDLKKIIKDAWELTESASILIEDNINVYS